VIQAYRGRGGGSKGVPREGAPPMNEFGFGDTKARFSSTGIRPYSPERPLGCSDVHVTGALCRKTDPKIATALKTQSRSKDQNKDKDNSK